MKSTVLIVDDDVQIQTLLHRIFTEDGYDVLEAATGDEALGILAQNPIDVVLLDLNLPGSDGLSMLSRMHVDDHSQPVVMISGGGSVEAAVRATKLGAVDFLQKPLSRERVLVTVANALRFERFRRDNEALHAANTQGLLGDSRAMHQLRRMIDKAAPTDSRVIITGENGTGKELVARAIHRSSRRSEGAFIKLNCAALPTELIESELFGHEQGAFTGANRTRRGKFELADEGTLFLDEIGEMPKGMQAKVLRVLQENELERVGSEKTLKINVRVIAATNCDLQAMVRRGEFRQDLFYRLHVIHIHTPPLREHPEDIRQLVRHFLHDASERNGLPRVEIDAEALETLMRYDYPGNVRELQNLIERLVILSDRRRLVAGDVLRQIGSTLPHDSSVGLFEASRSFKDLLDRSARRILEEALRHHDYRMTETARALGMERSHLYKKCHALNVALPKR